MLHSEETEFVDKEKDFGFTINEEKGNLQKFYFTRNTEGKPIKLGDGTYGVVYLIHREEKPYAVKLLYNKFNKPASADTVQCNLTDEIIKKFSSKFKITSSDDPLLTALGNLKNTVENFGSFAAQLRHLELQDEQYAFLLTEIQKGSESIALKRFEFEMNSAEIIRKKLIELKRDSTLSGVLDIIGGTRKFTDSAAYTTFKEDFKKLQMDISDFALVMPFYKWTLKDLLETGTVGRYAIEESIIESLSFKEGFSENLIDLKSKIFSSKQELNEAINSILDKSKDSDEQKMILEKERHIREVTGYDVLESMSFQERIATILPFLFDLTQGLSVLHIVGMYHYDLKPANIFIDVDLINRKKFNVVVGDLGFLSNPQNSPSTFDYRFSEVSPLGTRHYRSPEQKDYFDICNVDIEVNSEGMGVNLIVVDPKFQDTIIEPGDYLVFSKDRQNIAHEIVDIKRSGGEIRILLADLKKPLQPDKCTQAILYKKQGVRTDLFGIGAIAFDMLTCGRSPERFYEYIRTYDTDQENISETVDAYRRVYNRQSPPNRLAQAFEPFEHQRDPEYAPVDIVELILKCMLYKAQDSFKDVEAVSKKIEELHSQYHEQRLKNLLVVVPNNEQYIKRGKNNDALSDKIEELQNISSFMKKLQCDPLPTKEQESLLHLIYRLTHGVWYLKKLAEGIRDTWDTSSHSEQFFVEMLPENIKIKGNGLDLSGYVVYSTEEAYKKDLKENRVARITRDITNPFVPNYLQFFHRRIQLKPVSANSKTPEKDCTFEYLFPDSSLFGDDISKGDWIVMNKKLWKVNNDSTLDHEITITEIKFPDPVQNEKSVSTEDSKGKSSPSFYYKELKPCEYYLQMIGIYLYQIFFVGLGNNSEGKPLLVTVSQLLYQLTNKLEVLQLRDIMREPKHVDLNSIFQFIVSMYLKLTFCDYKRSYYTMYGNDLERINAVIQDTVILRNIIAKFLGSKTSAELDTRLKIETGLIDKVKKRIPKNFIENLNFDEIVLYNMDKLSRLKIYDAMIRI